MTKPEIFKGLPTAYCLKIAPELNAGKRLLLEQMQQEWSRVLPEAFDWYWSSFLSGGLFRQELKASGPLDCFPATAMVTSMKETMIRAVAGQGKGWASNLANRIARSVMRSKMPEEYRHQLLWLNKMRAWLLPYPKQVELLAAQPHKLGKLPAITSAASRAMRKLVRRYLERHRLPDPNQLPLQVNINSSVLAKAQMSRTPWASSWLRVTTLERGKRIELPVMPNAYADEVKGHTAQTFSLFEREGDWFVRKTVFREQELWSEHRTERLAIDLGLNNLMVTSEGDIYGVGFMKQLLRYDCQLQALQKGLQGAGIVRLAQCRRYRTLVARIRGFLKTTVQTYLERVLDLRRPKIVVIEDLLFAGQHGNLSKRMNRLLRTFGQRYFSDTLEQRQKLYGFELVKVEPAYTSQQCARCGFVHSGNRTGDVFDCIACGHRSHADVNAAKNQHGRSVLEAHRLPESRSTRWAQALDIWLASRKTAIAKATPGSSRHCRAVGSARAGMKALLERKDSAQRLSPKMKQRLKSCCDTTTPSALLEGIREVGSFSNKNALSTRYSG